MIHSEVTDVDRNEIALLFNTNQSFRSMVLKRSGGKDAEAVLATLGDPRMWAEWHEKTTEKKTYWEVHLMDADGNISPDSWIGTGAEVLDAELSQAEECGAEGDGYYLKAVRMTQEEIENLPEFMGW